MKKALITGITGQDGSYLTEYLLELGYEVHGLVRNAPSKSEDPRFERLLPIIHKIKFWAASLASFADIRKVVEQVSPDECYHLSAQSLVSYDAQDEFPTLNANITGTHHILEAVYSVAPQCRFFFAGSSEMFGRAEESPQSEKTKFHPRSVYGISKVAGFELTRNYRENRNLHASTGILFNHESPRRGPEFVTRKISLNVAKIKAGIFKELKLGRTDSMRDWGHAKEYVRAMHLMLQQTNPDDFVIATGKTHSVQDFIDLAFQAVDLDPKKYIKTDPALVRPSDQTVLVGNPNKAKSLLNWSSTVPFNQLVEEMVQSDLAAIESSSKSLEKH